MERLAKRRKASRTFQWDYHHDTAVRRSNSAYNIFEVDDDDSETKDASDELYLPEGDMLRHARREQDEVDDDDDEVEVVIPAAAALTHDHNSTDKIDVEDEVLHDPQVHDWRHDLPEEGSTAFPKKFVDVLKLMDKIVHNKGTVGSYVEELYKHKRHGNRPGKRTRDELRDLKERRKKKEKELIFPWHQPRKEWCPKTKKDLQEFIEVLMDIGLKFT